MPDASDIHLNMDVDLNAAERSIWGRVSTPPLLRDMDLPTPPPAVHERAFHRRSTPRNEAVSPSTFRAMYEMKAIDRGDTEVWKDSKWASSNVDVRALDYVTVPSENLICGICTAPFLVPMELGCKHSFCEDCIYEHLTIGIHSSGSCPTCRQPVEWLKPVPQFVHDLLDDLVAECPNRTSGCSKELKRYTVHDHLKAYCDFEEVSCASSECSKKVFRYLRPRGCLHAHIECSVCGELVMEKDLPVGIAFCPKRLLG